MLGQGRPQTELRLRAADMINLDEAAALVGESVRSVRQWVASGHIIGLGLPGQAMRLPRWQFDGDVLLWIGPITRALEAKSGWQVLSFLETPHGAFGGRTARQAIEQGDVDRVLCVASLD